MTVLLRIALRNLIEHKSKSLIIGIIIAIGVIIIIVGNSLMDTATLGIQRMFIDNYTGDIMISGKADGEVSLFGVQAVGGLEETPIIPDYREVREYVESLDGVEGFTPMISGFSSLKIENLEGRVFSLLFGIEPETYHLIFDNVEILEGRYLEPGEEGILISRDRLEEIEKDIIEENDNIDEYNLEIGDLVLVTGRSASGIRIREVPLRGVFDFKHEAEGADILSYIDAQTMRALVGLTISNRGEVSLNEEEENLLDLENFDDFFTDEIFSAEDLVFEEIEPSPTVSPTPEGIVFEEAGFNGIDYGSWNFILIKMNNPYAAEGVITTLNTWFEDNNIIAQAGDWKAAAGPFATSADIVRIVFNIAIIIAGIVAIIIIINTLVVSIIERTKEIGTMRALGAQKPFIWKMFVAEILTINMVFGIIGIILSSLIILVINLLNIQAENTFMRILFAGPVLKPAISPASIVFSLITVSIVGLLAHLYPVREALKIEPIKAIGTE